MRTCAQAGGGGVQGFELGPALDVELQDDGQSPGPASSSSGLLGDAGEHDFLRRRRQPASARRSSPDGNDVRTNAVGGDVADDVGVHVGFDRIANQRIELLANADFCRRWICALMWAAE